MKRIKESDRSDKFRLQTDETDYRLAKEFQKIIAYFTPRRILPW